MSSGDGGEDRPVRLSGDAEPAHEGFQNWIALATDSLCGAYTRGVSLAVVCCACGITWGGSMDAVIFSEFR